MTMEGEWSSGLRALDPEMRRERRSSLLVQYRQNRQYRRLFLLKRWKGTVDCLKAFDRGLYLWSSATCLAEVCRPE